MKKTFFLIPLLLLIIACKKESIQQKHEIFCYADFNTFYDKFVRDSLYQAQHINFPLDIIYMEESGIDSIRQIKEGISKYGLDKMLNVPDSLGISHKEAYFKSIVKKTDTIYCIYSTATYKRNIVYSFIKEKDCWFLQRIHDDSLYQPGPFRKSKLNQFVNPFKDKKSTIN